MALHKLVRRNYGRKLLVNIKYQTLHSFKEGMILLCQSILEMRRITHLHGSALFTIPLSILTLTFNGGFPCALGLEKLWKMSWCNYILIKLQNFVPNSVTKREAENVIMKVSKISYSCIISKQNVATLPTKIQMWQMMMNERSIIDYLITWFIVMF